ncbi:CDGSH iron-sulfur domain-containing protein [Marinobacterium litorale]|uniref:CDGSH iron-sulfur domain-containing protein n=1 Tax=Marinobacterium litorale TaxID=404770 RepID=UPI000429C5E8|nr:CDGSH iron-sulfur domain-containing protein [Marinobacterium litorale]
MSRAPVRRAGDEPVRVSLTKGELYTWCACGRSSQQPFCDGGSHVGTGIDPLVFEAERDSEVLLYTCKETGTPPICDGSHCRGAPD